MRNKANVTKRQSEKVYFKDKCLENSNQKDFWKTFNPYLSNKYKTSDIKYCVERKWCNCK